MKLKATRTYEIELPDDKDYTLELNGEQYPFDQLIDAITLEVELGHDSGTMLYVIFQHACEPGGDDICEWIHIKDRYDEFVIRTVEYRAALVEFSYDKEV